jgi:hypothetical protein
MLEADAALATAVAPAVTAPLMLCAAATTWAIAVWADVDRLAPSAVAAILSDETTAWAVAMIVVTVGVGAVVVEVVAVVAVHAARASAGATRAVV